LEAKNRRHNIIIGEVDGDDDDGFIRYTDFKHEMASTKKKKAM
jgi:hypothetical protein